ncbi:Hypothetical predicted protein [Paramuricea clavata]|uniref:Uncharacterized protein n=1 Tax=Paramuricea clavata TaxID=317549 RepID=A0A7D9ED41_PARCT|nr:Hypothetical predicted protein [Paramuricea clavata]
MREKSDEQYHESNIIDSLKAIGEYNEDKDEDISCLRQKLIGIERTRHFKTWYNLSTVSNHSHLVFMVTLLYDPAVYYTNEEFKIKTKQEVNVQAKVEVPQVHIIARSSSADSEQLAYIETRKECLCKSTDPISTENGNEVIDVMRFFHGDSPARQYKSGQQKGGHFYCPLCGANAHRVYELEYCQRSKYISLAERQQVVLQGPIGQKKSLERNNKPFAKLSKQAENFRPEESMKGLETINCQNYKILPFEPLHDISKHVENVFEELPHLKKDQAKPILDVSDVSLNGKDTKRTFDYRCSLVQVSLHTRGKIPSKAQHLLDTLVEIQQIAYASEEARTPRQVLRFHNLTWLHGILCTEVIGFQLKKLTCRKLYGNYFHNITSHAAMQNRIINGRSSNVEEQERAFNTIKNITKGTSSNHPNQLIGNILVRMQAEGKLKDYQNVVCNQQKQVTKLANALPSFGNSTFSHTFLVKHSKSWQAHLENISDYLLHGEGIWWKKTENGSIEFFDAVETQTVDQRALYSTTSDLQHLKVSRNILQHPGKSVWIKSRTAISCSAKDDTPSFHDTPDENHLPFTLAVCNDTLLDDQELKYEGLPQTDENNCRDATPTDSREVIMEPPVKEISTMGPSTSGVNLSPIKQNSLECVELSVDEDMQKEMAYKCSSSKISLAVETVLGLTQDVIQFDKARVRHKQHPKNATYSKDHNKMLAIIHTRISEQR